jgi:hypothetical protein
MASCHAIVLIACGLLRRGDCVRRLYTWPSVMWHICEVSRDYIGRQLIDQCDLPAGSTGNDGSCWYGSVRDKSKKAEFRRTKLGYCVHYILQYFTAAICLMSSSIILSFLVVHRMVKGPPLAFSFCSSKFPIYYPIM